MTEQQDHDANEAAGIGAALVEHVASFYGCEATEKACIRRAYKDNDCGPWLLFTETGLAMGCIVEGSDAEFDVTPFTAHVDMEKEEVHDWLKESAEYLEEMTSEATQEEGECICGGERLGMRCRFCGQ